MIACREWPSWTAHRYRIFCGLGNIFHGGMRTLSSWLVQPTPSKEQARYELKDMNLLSSTSKRCLGVIVLLVAEENNVVGFTIIGNNRQLRPWLHLHHDLSVSVEMAPQAVDPGPTIAKPDDFIKQEIERQGTDSVLPTLEDIHSVSSEIEDDPGPEATSSPPTTFSKRRDPRPFPLSMVIDQEEIKHALLLAAVNPRSIGVLISGGRGTGKSVIARSMKSIVPSHISRIRDSEYNIDPNGEGGIDSFLLEKLHNGEISLDSIETELIPTPFVQM